MNDQVTPMTAHARVVLARRGALRLHSVPAVDAAPGSPAEPAALDDRLMRRELLLHHLEMERQRRRRRSA
jgi:hypothetical protein